MKRILLAALACFLQPLQAHHGLDYMVIQDGQAPALWSVMPFAAADFSRGSHGEEFNIESGLLLGLGHDFGLGVSAGYTDDEDTDWRYSAVTPYLSVPLFRSDSLPWLRVSLYAGYQFAADPESAYREVTVYEMPAGKSTAASITSTSLSTTSTASKTSSAHHKQHKTSKHTGGGGGGGGPDAPSGGGHDHPVAAPAVVTTRKTTTQKTAQPVPVTKRIPVDPYAGATGIHRHGEEGMVARLITTIDLNKSNQLAFNLINFTPRSGHTGWGYAAGWRHSFNHDFSFSVEAMGDFDSDAWHEVLGAVHWSPVHWMVLKLGAGTGLGSDSSDLSLHTGLVLRF